MTAIELGKAVWDRLPIVWKDEDELNAQKIIGEAILAERERCAKIAEGICQHPKGMWKCETWEAAKVIARKIREGSEMQSEDRK